MPTGLRKLTEDDLWVLTGQVDVPAVLRSSFAALTCPEVDWAELDPDDGTAVLIVPDPDTGGHASLPAPAVRAIRAAGCAAVAAQDRLGRGVVTAGVIGPVPEVWWHVRVLCQAIPAITDLAVTALPGGAPPPFLADHLDLAGVELVFVHSASDAAFGANLVVAAGTAPLDAEKIATGAVLVEAAVDAYPFALQEEAAPDTFCLVPHAPDHDARNLDTAVATALLTAASHVAHT